MEVLIITGYGSLTRPLGIAWAFDYLPAFDYRTCAG
jgi:hypothetical protein